MTTSDVITEKALTESENIEKRLKKLELKSLKQAAIFIGGD